MHSRGRCIAGVDLVTEPASYSPPATCRLLFRQMVAAGDKDTIYSILRWVVPQSAMLEKRAFVGYYLSFPDVRPCIRAGDG